MVMATEVGTQGSVMTMDTLLEHWQGHRRLTRKTIEAFPDEKLFEFSIGGMRTFGQMACEFLGMALPTVRGMTTQEWEQFEFAKPKTKADVLAMWDEQTARLDAEFPGIPVERFGETMKAFGQWEMTGIGLLEYVIENEVHHRGQGYVYLRALGIEPPAFWERS